MVCGKILGIFGLLGVGSTVTDRIMQQKSWGKCRFYLFKLFQQEHDYHFYYHDRNLMLEELDTY